MRKHVECMLEFQNKGSFVFDYGNNLREGARLAGLENAFDFPGFVPAYIRPLFCEGYGPLDGLLFLETLKIFVLPMKQ